MGDDDEMVILTPLMSRKIVDGKSRNIHTAFAFDDQRM